MSEAILKLRNGVNREIIKNLVHSNKLFHTDRHELEEKVSSLVRQKFVESQGPKVALVTCADSRIVSHAIFQQGIGDIFELKVAGNVINSSIVASLEFAVSNLGTTLIVIMGHENCGAVQGALNHKNVHEHDHLTPCLKELMLGIQKGIECFHEDIDVVARKNVKNSVNNLFEYSSLIREKHIEGEIDIIGAYYNLKSGLVEFIEI